MDTSKICPCYLPQDDKYIYNITHALFCSSIVVSGACNELYVHPRNRKWVIRIL